MQYWEGLLKDLDYHLKKESNDKNSMVISKDGRKVSSKLPFSSGCGYSLATSHYRFIKGTLNSFKVKCNSINGHHWMRVGIVAKYDSRAYRFDDNENCGYALSCRGMLSKGGKDRKDLQETEKWRKGDIITIRVDSLNWEITFEKNGKVIGKPQAIAQSDVYYPAIAMCQCEGNDCEIID